MRTSCRALPLLLLLSEPLRRGGAWGCVPPCGAGFRCGDRCSETVALDSRDKLSWTWDLGAITGWESAAVDYTFHALDGSMLAVALVESHRSPPPPLALRSPDVELAPSASAAAVQRIPLTGAMCHSERKVIDKLKRNKRRTEDDTGWLISESRYARRPSASRH